MSAAICSAVPLWSWLPPHFQTLWHLKNTILLWSPIIAGRRTQGNNRAGAAYLQHITSSLPKKWWWPKNRRPTVTICPPDCDNGKSIFGHHFSLSYSGTLFLAITEDDEGSQRTLCSFFIFIFLRWETRRKRKREEGAGMLYLPQSSISPMAPCRGTNWSWK